MRATLPCGQACCVSTGHFLSVRLFPADPPQLGRVPPQAPAPFSPPHLCWGESVPRAGGAGTWHWRRPRCRVRCLSVSLELSPRGRRSRKRLCSAIRWPGAEPPHKG